MSWQGFPREGDLPPAPPPRHPATVSLLDVHQDRYHLPVFRLRHLLFLVELPQFLIFLSQVLFREDRVGARHG